MESPFLMDETTYGWLFFDDQARQQHCSQYQSIHNEFISKPQQLEQQICLQADQRLGKYFENLIYFWLTERPEYTVIARNQVIQAESKTLGELDFLFRDNRNNKLYHWEVAVKFYLAFQHKRGWRNFIGPNTQDRLDKKLDKLIHYQSQLFKAKETGLQLAEIDLSGIISKIFLKGYLFYPYHDFNNSSMATPYQSMNTHEKGWWLYQKEVSVLTQSQYQHWIVLNKLQWLSKAMTMNHSKLFDTADLMTYIQQSFQQSTQPLLICAMQAHEDGYVENNRGFVVCDQWPEISI